MAIVIDAVKMCEDKTIDFKNRINVLENKLGYKPEFVIINASNDDGNERYIKNKVKQGTIAGLNVSVKKFEEDCTNEDILGVINSCKENKIPVVLQLPTFEHLDTKAILDSITPEVDADGFTSKWIGEVNLGNEDGIIPATPRGVMNILDYHDIDVSGKVALVIGRSNHVGKPISSMLINRGATTISANSKTKDLDSLIKQADVIISCVGKKDLIKYQDVKENAVLIGVGFTYINGRQILDFDIEDMVLRTRAYLVSNRINCTGKATVNALIENVIKLYEMNF